MHSTSMSPELLAHLQERGQNADPLAGYFRSGAVAPAAPEPVVEPVPVVEPEPVVPVVEPEPVVPVVEPEPTEPVAP